MSQAAPAPQGTTGAQPPVKGQKVFTLPQEQVAREYLEHHGIEREQIGFEGESVEPIFDFEALSVLALKLASIPSISVTAGDYNPAVNLATANCRITLAEGQVREMFGQAFIGEVIYDGTVLDTPGKALNAARSRSLRTCLRAVGFDPVKAHKVYLKGDTLELKLKSADDVRKSMIAEAHVLGEEIGLITTTGDKAGWYKMIGVWFPGLTSTQQMDEEQLGRFVATLRALKNVGASTVATSGAGAGSVK